MHNINPIDSDSIDSSAPPQIMMAAAPVEDYPPVNEDLNPNVNNYPVKAATIKDEVYAKPSEEYPPEKPIYDDKKNEALLPELKVDGKKVQPKSEFEIIRNICITCFKILYHNNCCSHAINIIIAINYYLFVQ